MLVSKRGLAGTPAEGAHMLRFLLGRLAVLIPTFIGVSIIAFSFIRLLPGDPVALLVGRTRHVARAPRADFARARLRPADGHPVSRLSPGRRAPATSAPPSLPRSRSPRQFFTLFPATLELSTLRHHPCGRARHPGRHLRGRPARLDPRPDAHGLGPGRLFHADLLVGPAADHPVCRHPAVDACLGPHLADVLLSRADRLHADRLAAFRPDRARSSRPPAISSCRPSCSAPFRSP